MNSKLVLLLAVVLMFAAVTMADDNLFSKRNDRQGMRCVLQGISGHRKRVTGCEAACNEDDD